MKDINIIKLDNVVYEDNPHNLDIIIQTKRGEVPDIVDIQVDDCMITSAESKSGYVYGTDEIRVCKEFLKVPGIGYLTPGARVIYKNKDYALLYGWHTNISNQTIMSWYLKSLEEECADKTVYKEMINEFEIVHFK